MKKLRIYLRKIFAAFIALVVFTYLGKFLILLGIVLAGYTINFFDIQPGEGINPDTLESIGLIVNVLISGYVGLKVYKKIAPSKEIIKKSTPLKDKVEE
ncbi:hypothetical protein N9746_06430 [Candidatus Thioglobus sp.]|nr:hypothetical protein [Candidatus Thioglobus sp.]